MLDALLALVNYVVVAGDRDWQFHAAHAAMIVAFVLFSLRKLDWLAVRPPVFVGGISYSLYLLHQFIGVSMIALIKRGYGLPDLLVAAIAALACGLLAFALTRLVEVPGKRGLLNWGAAVLPRAKSRFPTLAFARG